MCFVALNLRIMDLTAAVYNILAVFSEFLNDLKCVQYQYRQHFVIKILQ